MRKINIFILIALVLLIAACNPGKDKSVSYTSGVYQLYMDTTVVPGDDFHAFVNGTWIKNTEIPADKSSYGIGMILHEKSQDDVKAIIEELAASENQQGSDEQMVGDLFASYMDMEKRNELGIAPMQPELDKVEALSSHEELPGYFGYASRKSYGNPIRLMVMADFKRPTHNALYNYQGGLGLPDREYYLSDEEKMVSNRKAYKSHIAKMFELCGVSNVDKHAETVLKLETSFAKIHWEKEKNRNRDLIYNKYSTDSLKYLTPDFDWAAMLDEFGVSNLEYLVVTQESFFQELNGLITSTSMDDWKTYLKWCVIDGDASKLNEALDKQNFEFYSKTLRGTQEQLPLWRRAVNSVNGNLGEVVGKVYVKKHFPAEAKARMTDLVENLRKAYEVSIKDLDWMGEETKVQALDKLSKFTPKIGYPDKWKDYSGVTIKSDEFYNNLASCAALEHKRTIDKIGKPIDKTEWHMTPQTVNAYYDPTQNEIVFPAAILQPPFFDLNADDAVNYGAIGGVIGHEMGHGFDDQGSKFDGDGVLRNWWTDRDREEFKKRTDNLVIQYDAFKVFDDLNVNGTFTLGENIGDLGGLSIGLKAYQLSLNGKEAPVIDGYTGIQRVFFGWAQVWRKKTREEALRMQVNTDPHSPGKFRVNGVVRNVPEFYQAFNVNAENDLYLPEEERVKIW